MSTQKEDTVVEEGKPLKNRKFRQTKRFKWLVGIVLFALFVVFGFAKLTEYLAANLIQSTVTEQTKGAYELKFSDLKIDWLSTTIILSEVRYDKVVLNKNDTSNLDVYLKVNELYIALNRISDIYFSKTLHVDLINIIHPELDIKKKRNLEKRSSFSFETGKLYEMLQGFVSTFQVDELTVENMHFDYYAPEKQIPFTVNDLSFTIKNFHLDSSSIESNDQFFFTESFDLKVVDQTVLFSDGLHYSHFDSLILSTSTNKIEVFGVSTDTLNGAGIAMSEKAHNRYFTQVPYAGIIGLDFKMAYQEDVLHVDSMLYQNPKFSGSFVSVHKDSNKLKFDPNIENNVVALVLSIFNKVELDQFRLNNASLSANYGNNESANIESLTLEFTNYVIDSMDLRRDVYYPNFEELVLRINNPKFQLPNESILKASDLTFSTFSSALTINNVHITDGENASKQSDLLGDIDQIRLVGIHPKEIMDKRVLWLDSLLVLNPTMELAIKNKKQAAKPFDIHAFLNKNLSSYQVKRIDIVNGSVVFRESFKHSHSHGIKRINVALNGFRFDDASLKRNRFLLSSSAYLSLMDVSVFAKEIQHEIDFKEIKINSRKHEMLVNGFEMSPLIVDSSNIKLLARVNANRFLLDGLNLNALTNIKSIDIRQLELSDVDADIVLMDKPTQDSVQKFDLEKFVKELDSVDVNNIRFSNLNLLVRKNGKSLVKFSSGRLHVNELSAMTEHLEKGELKFMIDSLAYGLSDLTLPLAKAKHMITMKDLSRSYDSTLVVTDLMMNPIPGVVIPDSAFKGTIYLPQLKISDFHTFDKRFTDTLNLGRISLLAPNVKIRLPKKDTTKAKFKLMSHFNEPILGGDINAVSIESFRIENGKIDVSKDSLSVLVGDLNLNSKNWFISDSTEWLRNRFFWAEDFNLNLAKLKYDVPGLKIHHSVDSLSYHFHPNIFTIYGINVNSGKELKKDSNTFFSLYLPDIKIKSPHIYEYLTDSVLVIDTIITSGGVFKGDFFAAKKDSSSVKSKVKFIMPDQIPSNLGGMKRIAVHAIYVEHMDSEIKLHGKKNISPLDIDEFSLRVDSFHIEPNEKVDSNRVLWADNIVLDVKNIMTDLDDGLIEFGADEFHFSTKEDSIGIKNITFVPKVNRYEYPLHKGGFQRDVFTIHTKEIGVSNLNFVKALYQKKINAGYIMVDRASLNILKDKRNLKPPYKYKAIIPEMFKQLPVSLTFDSLVVKDMRVLYEESPEKGRNSGSIKLTHMNIVAHNVTNDTLELNKDSLLVIEMNSKLLDTADLNFKITYNMLSPDNRFNMSTTLGPIDGRLFNPFLEPVYKAKIKSANVHGMEMSAIGNDSVSGGKMSLYYEDLKFSFLDMESGESKGFNKLKSGFGNAIIKQNNKYHPLKGRKPLFFERDTGKGWIGYLIKIELSGISSSVGLKKYRKDLRKINKELWKAFDKKDREERKQRAKENKLANKKAKKQTKNDLRIKQKEDKKARKLNRKNKKNKP